MVRRKENATVQMNLRVTKSLFGEVEASAAEHRITFSQEVRSRLAKANPSFADYLADFERLMGDTLENSGPKTEIEARLRCRADLGALLRGMYTNAERLLLPHMTNPKVRELMRGKGGKS
jgi:hypothetical protein